MASGSRPKMDTKEPARFTPWEEGDTSMMGVKKALESQQALLWVGLAGSRPGCGKTPAWRPAAAAHKMAASGGSAVGQDGRHLRGILS